MNLRYLSLALFSITAQLTAQNYAVPEEGLLTEPVLPLTASDITTQEIRFNPHPCSPASSGQASTPQGHTGGYQASFAQDGAVGYLVTCPNAVSVLGMCSVSGRATADIEFGAGNASVYSGAKSDITYGGVLAHAQDEKNVAIASLGAPVGVGGGITMFGFGGQFSATVTPDQPNETTAILNGADSKGWQLGATALVVIVTNTYGNINLAATASHANASGTISGKAKGGALVVFKKTSGEGDGGKDH